MSGSYEPLYVVKKARIPVRHPWLPQSASGEWAIEGVGVNPDIEVENPPEAVLRGEDAQLDRAIQEVMQRLQTQPGTLPPKPADPVKTPGAH